MVNSDDTPAPEFLCYTDGASRGNPGSASYAFIIIKNGSILHEESGFLGCSTNNVAEYMAVIHGLSWLGQITGGPVQVYSDSQLVMRQMSGTYSVKKPHLVALQRDASELARRFESVTYHSVPRENPYIRRADMLCNQELDRTNKPQD
ncbi:MAG: ribonuclease HI family protein [Methanomicrobiales archaeon]